MKKKFRLLSLILICLMLSTVACSNKDDDKQTVKDNVVIDSQETDKEAKNEDTQTPKTDGEEQKDTSKTDTEETVTSDKVEEKKVSELPLVEGGIKSVYEQFGLKAGTCISETMITQAKYSTHIVENYSSVTMENDMKPDYILNKNKSIEAGDIVVEFNQRTINMLEWAKSNGIPMRGHTIVWYSQTPQWIFYEGFDISNAKVDRDTMLKRMESYIKQVFEQLDSLGYLENFYAYDVVNEAVMEDGSLRDCLWKQIIGDDYIWYAFYYADKYAPEYVKLYYNDYNEQFKTEHIVKLAQSLVDDSGRSLIDGIGCQGHLYTKDSIDDYLKTLEAFSATGLDVQITELDVCLGTWPNILPPTKENLIDQGKYYYELINRIVEANKAGITSVSGITFWGISDSLSWRSERNPLLFDKLFRPKYAYFGAVQQKENAGY